MGAKESRIGFLSYDEALRRGEGGVAAGAGGGGGRGGPALPLSACGAARRRLAAPRTTMTDPGAEALAPFVSLRLLPRPLPPPPPYLFIYLPYLIMGPGQQPRGGSPLPGLLPALAAAAGGPRWCRPAGSAAGRAGEGAPGGRCRHQSRPLPRSPGRAVARGFAGVPAALAARCDSPGRAAPVPALSHPPAPHVYLLLALTGSTHLRLQLERWM